VIDIHCHLLPGIDDGPATLADALALARALVEDGVTHVVATPHVYPGLYNNLRSSIGPVAKFFAAELRQAGLPLHLSWAGELRLTPEVLDLMQQDELPSLGTHNGLRTVLLEMPDGQVPMGAERFVSQLLQHKYLPIIVHPERNKGVMDNIDRLRPLVEMGCPVQVTAASLVGGFGSRAQDTALDLLDEGWVSVVATDAHNLGGRRPRLSEARTWLEQNLGAETAHELTVAMPARLCGWRPPALKAAA